MATMIPGWTTLSENPAVLVQEYVFGPGKANAMAVALPGRRWMIVSPSPRQTVEEAAAFREHGEVVAIVENNGMHHMGLGACRALFPGAMTYAAPQAAARIRTKSDAAGELEPIEKLVPLLGDAVSVVAAPGCKLGDVIVRVRTERGTMLYPSDFIANITAVPHPVFRLIFKLTRSGPGLSVFRIFFSLYVADRKAAIDFLIREIEADPPATLVPAHGAVVSRPDLGPALVGMLRAAR